LLNLSELVIANVLVGMRA